MNLIPKDIEAAACAAAVSASKHICHARDLAEAAPIDIAMAEAHAYGVAVAQVALSGVINAHCEALGRIAARATAGEISRVRCRSVGASTATTAA